VTQRNTGSTKGSGAAPPPQGRGLTLISEQRAGVARLTVLIGPGA